MDTTAIIKYFGLNEHPFMTSPDPRFLYFSSQVKEALAKCEFMARDRIGPIYMYGPIGSGKTSLVRRLQEKLSQDKRYNIKLLISPNLKSSNAFMRLISETFDVKTERSYTASLANFEKFLITQPTLSSCFARKNCLSFPDGLAPFMCFRGGFSNGKSSGGTPRPLRRNRFCHQRLRIS
jgi:type II secretory pathway predicted ATPase ExeA